MLLSNGLILIIAVLHIYFLVLEMFLWTRPYGLRIFGQTQEQANASAALAANQGLYNGFLAVGLLWGLIHPSAEVGYQFKIFFLSCVFIAGLYGGLTVSRRIFLIQALPAIFAIGFLINAGIR